MVGAVFVTIQNCEAIVVLPAHLTDAFVVVLLDDSIGPYSLLLVANQVWLWATVRVSMFHLVHADLVIDNRRSQI